MTQTPELKSIIKSLGGVENARKIAKELPVTKDGVPITHGTLLYTIRRNGRIDESEYWEHCGYCECLPDRPDITKDDVCFSYSTREAAEAALKERTNP